MAKPFKHRNKFRIRITDSEGRRISKTFDTEDECQAFAAQVELDRRQAKLGINRLKPLDRTYEQLCDRWRDVVMSRKRSAKDDASMMRCHLLPTFSGQLIHTISTDQVDRLRQRLERERKPKTVRNILTLLRSQLKYAHDLEWISKVPKFRMPKVKLVEEDFRYLKSKDEIRRFLRAARVESETAYVLYATAIYTGMRKGELAALTWSQIDLDRRLIFVDRSHSGPTKSGTKRHIPIMSPLLPVLRQWRLRGFNPLVFPNGAGNQYDENGRIFTEVLHRVIEQGGFEPVVDSTGVTKRYLTFHGLRHTFASHFMMNGGDLFKLQKIGGWKSTEMVMRYSHLSPSAFEDVYELFGTEKDASIQLGKTLVTDIMKG